MVKLDCRLQLRLLQNTGQDTVTKSHIEGPWVTEERASKGYVKISKLVEGESLEKFCLPQILANCQDVIESYEKAMKEVGIGAEVMKQVTKQVVPEYMKLTRF